MVFNFIYELLKNEQAGYDAVKPITDYFFLRLCNKEYEITRSIYYAFSKYEFIDFANRTRYLINYINACKQMGDNKTLRKELSKLDVSAMQAQFIIAKYCLEDNTAKILEGLNQTYPDSYNAVYIRDWPIFINFRKTKEYEAFVKEHKEDFAIQEITIDNNEFIMTPDDNASEPEIEYSPTDMMM